MTRSTLNAREPRRRRTLALSGALLACLTATALISASAIARPGPTTGSKPQTLQNDLDALVAAGAPGAILLVRNGNRTVRLTSGLADVAETRAMRVSDHFKIASLTKTYTATVVLQLVAEGKLGLGDTVERRLPGVVPYGRKVMIRQLLNHTSGIPEFETDPRYLRPYLSGNFAHYWAPRQLVRFALSHKPLFRPGTGYSYSNTNYVLAGLIVERATGRSIGTELKRRIFQPLRLRETTYPTKPGLPRPFAHGYMVLGNPPAIDVTGLSPSMSPASGAIVSTVDDVATFYRALLSGRLLRPSQLRAMKTTVSLRTGKMVTVGPGSGLGISRPATSCVGWNHAGQLPGFEIVAISSGNGSRQVVIMVNGSTMSKRGYTLFENLIDRAYCKA